MAYNNLQDAVTGFQSDADRISIFGNGDASAAYTTKDGTSVPSLRNMVAQWNAQAVVDTSSAVAQASASAAAAAASATTAQNASALQFVTAAGSANIKPNTTYTRINPAVSVATITGGGDPSDTQLIGYTKATQYFLGAGSSYTFNSAPVTGNVSDLKLTRKIADGTVAVLTYTTGTPTGTQWSGTIIGSTVAITLGTALNSGEYIRCEDNYAAVATGGQAPSYGSIHAGYDNSIQSGLMNHIVSSAHSHIDDQDGTPGHVMIFGGSANYITGAIAYSAILAGTGNEVRNGAGNGSVILGGIYNKVSGTTSAILAGERCKVTATYAIVAGQGHTVGGTASVALGRGHTVNGANSLAIGNANTISADNSVALGNTGTVNSGHTYSALLAGYKPRTLIGASVVRFAYRDSTAGTNAQLQDGHNYMSGYWGDQTTHLLTATNDGATTDIPLTAGYMTLYKIKVVARASNIQAGFWLFTVGVRAPSGTLSSSNPAVIVQQTTDFSYVDGGLGAGANAAGVTVQINPATGAGLQIQIKQRVDAAVGTKWAASVEAFELT